MADDSVQILGWGKATRHRRTGELGARSHVRATHNGWQARYHIDSHGKNPAKIARDLEAVDAHHRAWAGKLNECAAAQGVEIVVSGTVYRVVDYTIPAHQPEKRCRLIVGIRRVEGETLHRVDGFPMVLFYDSLSEVPANAAIIAAIRARLEEAHSVRAAHESFMGRVEAELRKGRRT